MTKIERLSFQYKAELQEEKIERTKRDTHHELHFCSLASFFFNIASREQRILLTMSYHGLFGVLII